MAHSIELEINHQVMMNNTKISATLVNEQCLLLPVSNKQSVTILDNARFHRRGILRGMQGKKRREVEHLASIFNATGGIFDQKHRRCVNCQQGLVSCFYFN